MERRVVFGGWVCPAILLLPQMAVTIVFFFWPAGQAVVQSFLRGDAFGLSTEHSRRPPTISRDTARRPCNYLASFGITALFSFSVAILALAPGLLLAVMADRVVRGAAIYKTVLLIPYAIAPAVAGVLWMFMFNPSIGVLAAGLRWIGVDWNYLLNAPQAIVLVILAAAWKQVSYNFLFFLAGLQAIPASLIEASAIDGATPRRRFWTIIFPLLAPTSLFLLIVVNIVYAFFETFGVIHNGRDPRRAEQGAVDHDILVYKVWYDGVVRARPSAGRRRSRWYPDGDRDRADQAIQFKFVERRVHYA